MPEKEGGKTLRRSSLEGKLEESQEKLEDRIHELEVISKATIGREVRIAQLKKENEELRERLKQFEKGKK